VQDFSQILTSAATDVFGKVKRNVDFKNKLTNKAWFNEECQSVKKEFKIKRNFFNRNKTDANKMAFVRACTKYNKTKKKAKFKYKSTEGHKLSKLAKSNPRKFWKILKK